MTRDILWLDLESFSECDLFASGSYRYAEDPSTELLVAQWALNDEEPIVRDLTGKQPLPPDLLELLDDPSIEIRAHNGGNFDRIVLRHVAGLDTPIERWFDVMVQAYAHGLPGALDKIAPVLGLPADQHKDKRGKELVQLFCKPRPKNHNLRRATRDTHPTEWREFLEYSRRDIIAMRAVSKKMPTWNYNFDRPAGQRNMRMWQIDQRINNRGMAVDLELARAAVKAADKEKARLKAAVREATNGEVDGPSKRDQLLEHILKEYGVDLPDMRADTLRRRVEDPDLPDGVRLLLSLRLEATKTSTAKYQALIDSASADGRLRGAHQFAGASRTGRFAHRLFQPGNMPRPDLPKWEIAQGIEAIKAGNADFFTDNVMRLLSNTIRGCVVASEGMKLDVADLSNIEGRIGAWLGGEEWKLQAFRDFDTITGNKPDGKPIRKGPDLYVAAYARSFSVSPDSVVENQRQIGKVMELGLLFGGGVAAFLTFAAVYRMDLEDLAEAVWESATPEAIKDAEGWHRWAVKKNRTYGLPEHVFVACQVLVTAWREAHPQTVAIWARWEEAVRKAILHPGTPFDIGEHMIAQVNGDWLRVRLPSGRALCYLKPDVSDGITFYGVSPYSRQWRRQRTYGGRGFENAVQATALDVLTEGMAGAEEAGYRTVISIHDELVTEVPDSEEYTHTELASIMAKVPTWAPGLPLAAAGFETPRYKKG